MKYIGYREMGGFRMMIWIFLSQLYIWLHTIQLDLERLNGNLNERSFSPYFLEIDYNHWFYSKYHIFSRQNKFSNRKSQKNSLHIISL